MKTLDLRNFKIPLGRLAPLDSFRTCQGDLLSYRVYPAWSEDLIILYHGVASDSRYMCVLASTLAAMGVATVVTPDLRCHGLSLSLTDEISSFQLEFDLVDLIAHLQTQRSFMRLTLAGHSMGGGFVLRVAVSELRSQFAKFVALAPKMPLVLNAFYDGYGGWIEPEPSGGFSVNMPEMFRSGQEKLHYSASYIRAASASDDLMECLRALAPKLQVVIGAEDEINNPERCQELFAEVGIPCHIISHLNHLTLVAKPESYVSLF